MRIPEQALKNALSSREGNATGRLLVDKVSQGEPLVINLEDDTKLVLTTTFEAIETLVDRFDWNGSINWSDDTTAVYVLGVCQKLADRFTVSDVLRRVVVERPAAILEFPSAWGRLVRHKFIRRIKRSEPSVYEVTAGHDWL